MDSFAELGSRESANCTYQSVPLGTVLIQRMLFSFKLRAFANTWRCENCEREFSSPRELQLNAVPAPWGKLFEWRAQKTSPCPMNLLQQIEGMLCIRGPRWFGHAAEMDAAWIPKNILMIQHSTKPFLWLSSPKVILPTWMRCYTIVILRYSLVQSRALHAQAEVVSTNLSIRLTASVLPGFKLIGVTTDDSDIATRDGARSSSTTTRDRRLGGARSSRSRIDDDSCVRICLFLVTVLRKLGSRKQLDPHLIKSEDTNWRFQCRLDGFCSKLSVLFLFQNAARLPCLKSELANCEQYRYVACVVIAESALCCVSKFYD